MGDESDADRQDLIECGIEDAGMFTSDATYRGTRSRKLRHGELDQVKASIEKIKARRARRLQQS